MAEKIYVVTGHYGSGKTNFSVNLALKIKEKNPDWKITVCDLDIVNPYFRTADFNDMLGQRGIKLVAPGYANTNLDIPAINFDLNGLIQDCNCLIADVGGDDAGAIALGCYREILSGCEMLCVINEYRRLTRTAEQAVEIMREIETASGLRHTAVVNNSNLGSETAEKTVEDSVEFAENVCSAAGLPLFATVFSKELEPEVPKPFPAEIFVKTPWDR